MNTVLPVEKDDVLAALRSFLRRLMDGGVVDAIFVPMQEGATVMPALVTDPALLEMANPLMPLMPLNNARAISALTGKQAPAKIGVVLRPCEIRALVELVKLQQATLEDVVIIGMDCPGTYELNEFLSKYAEHGVQCSANFAEYLTAAKEGREPLIEGLALRSACQMCVRPVPEDVDIHIHLFGVDVSQGLQITLKDEIAAALQITEPAAGGGESVGEAIAGLTEARKRVRENRLVEIRQKMSSNGGLSGLFTACIRCHNCMTACPICYCRTCLFKTAAFDHEPAFYLNAARRKGATRMLGDTLLFHLTRLNHMSTSCVSCGMCTSACPSDIPVGTIFSAIAEQVQAEFEYVPGHAVAEPLPLITFRADEWSQIGEEK
ncbi:MAG TPA: 4Fe-4S dicluster domain-containing protein [Anaerolineales bacterium]|nr:4Fe-4S dicluster domain-containing protein [Anaerolineales bacterium]